MFQVDTAALLARASVDDSLGTLRRTCPWASGRPLDLIVKVMHALDSEGTMSARPARSWGSVTEESRRRVESFGGGSTFGPPIDWEVLLTAGVLEKLLSRGSPPSISASSTRNSKRSGTWPWARWPGWRRSTRIRNYRKPGSLRAYFVAFDQVWLKLKGASTLHLFRNTTILEGTSRPSAMSPRPFGTGSSFRATISRRLHSRGCNCR